MATQDQSQNQNQSGKENTGKQGFASMDPEKQKEIASEGGKASHNSDSSKKDSDSDDEDSSSDSSKRGQKQ